MTNHTTHLYLIMFKLSFHIIQVNLNSLSCPLSIKVSDQYPIFHLLLINTH